MKCLITGASSGIGLSMAKYLASKNYELILVARRKEILESLQKELPVKVTIYAMDLSNEKNVYKLYENVKKENIDILINNAGFGLFGKFVKTDLNRELQMIDVNIKAYHILTKLFLQDFYQRDYGYILNVCSSAGFLVGPNLSTYYATKNYITKLTLAIYEELKHAHSKVVISALCPGPVNTEFNKVAKGKFIINGLDADKVAKKAIDKLFKHKPLIVVGPLMKITLFLVRFAPYKLMLKISYYVQYRKSKSVN